MTASERVWQVRQPRRGIEPFNCHPGAALERRNRQVEGASPIRIVARVHAGEPIEHPSLMSRILVKDVDVFSDQFGDAKIGQVPADLALRLREKLLKCGIDGDDVIGGVGDPSRARSATVLAS